MAKAHRIRLRRKDLKAPDEFHTLGRQAAQWVQANQQKAILGGGAILVVLVSIAVTLAYGAARSRDANADLARAMATLRANNDTAAATELSQVAQRWSSTRIGALAAALAANTTLRQGDTDAAIRDIQPLVDDGKDLPPYLRQQLLVAWGDALLQKGDWDAAAGKYQAASGISGPYTGNAILGEARAREKAGQAERAKELYRSAYEQFPDLPEREVIR